MCVKFRQVPTADSVKSIKLADLATLAVIYRRLLVRISYNNNQIWFNSSCKKLNLLPNYTNIKCNTKSLVGRRAINLARSSWRNSELRKGYATRNNLCLHLKVVHTELAARLHSVEFDWLDNKFRAEVAEISHIQYVKQKAKLDVLRDKAYPFNRRGNSGLSGFQFHSRFKNLSSVGFSGVEVQMLSNGVNFAPVPNTIGVQSFESLAVDAETALYGQSAQLKSICALQIKKSIVNASSSTSSTSSTSSQSSVSSNNNLKVIGAIKKKLRDNDLIACKADKGNTITILTRIDYCNKISDFITESKALELNRDPTRSFKTAVSKCINHCPKVFDGTGWRFSVMNPSAPILYGLPKIHKEGIPIRPIVAYCNAPAYKLCKGFINFFNSHTNFVSAFSVKNSVELISKIQDVDIPLHSKLVSFDVASLFTSIPISVLSQIVCAYLDRDVVEVGLRNELKMIFETCIKQNYFCFDNKYFSFTDGLPMGSPLSPLLAEIFMNFFEQTILSSNNPYFRHVIFWYRYVDDILCLWNGTDRLLTSFLTWLNSQYPTINFTLEKEENKSINFLDITITRINSSLEFKIYRKPTYTDAIIPNSSNHPHNIKMSAFHSFIDRLINIPLTKSNYNEELNIILEIAANNGYAAKTILKLLNRKLKQKTLANIYPPDSPMPKNWRRLEYIGKTSQRISNIVTKHTDISFAFYNNNTIKKMIFNNKPRIDRLSKSGVYKINCNDCSSSYIGQTGRNFEVRVKEHLSGSHESSLYNHLTLENHTASLNNLEILHVQPKSRRLDNLESYEIRKAIFLNQNILNEQREIRFSPITDPALFYSHTRTIP